MTNKGKHASSSSGGFYRDLAMMILGIVLVGAAVFLILYLIADEPEPAATTAEETTTTISEATTSSDASTTSASPSTTAPSTTTTIPVRSPEEVRVMVLNSMGLTGAAGRMTTELADAGYQTLPADDFAPEQDPSRIWYREGFSAEANELLDFIPDALVEPLPDESIGEGADVVMVLGTGYTE